MYPHSRIPNKYDSYLEVPDKEIESGKRDRQIHDYKIEGISSKRRLY